MRLLLERLLLLAAIVLWQFTIVVVVTTGAAEQVFRASSIAAGALELLLQRPAMCGGTAGQSGRCEEGSDLVTGQESDLAIHSDSQEAGWSIPPAQNVALPSTLVLELRGPAKCIWGS